MPSIALTVVDHRSNSPAVVEKECKNYQYCGRGQGNTQLPAGCRALGDPRQISWFLDANTADLPDLAHQGKKNSGSQLPACAPQQATFALCFLCNSAASLSPVTPPYQAQLVSISSDPLGSISGEQVPQSRTETCHAVM